MSSRWPYLDNLKILLVVGVIAVHTAVTYGFDGTWYLECYDEMARGLVDAVTVVVVIGWLFGLGLFFLIAGRLTSPSLDRKGPGRFARERLIRLGVPVLAYTLLVSPHSSISTTARTRTARAASGRSSGTRSGTSDPARRGSSRRSWRSRSATRCYAFCARRPEPPRESRCRAITWRASGWLSPSARLPPIWPFRSAASSSTSNSARSRST
jgi:hypothetical protein